MNRTTRNRIKQGALYLGAAGIAAGLFYMSGGSFYLFLVIIFALLVPGMIQARFWRDYLAGQSRIAQKKHLEAIVYFHRFLKMIRARPELKKLIWINARPYTRDVEVMTLVNLGVCHLWLNELKKADTALKEAAKLDPESPLPYYNLALLSQAKDDFAKALEYLDQAESLGFKRSSIAQARQSILAEAPEDQTDPSDSDSGSGAPVSRAKKRGRQASA
ncbi:MAG: tetratricopeptide repeat protein [Gammaproteobacteria bacterium]